MSLSFPWALRALRSRPVVLGAALAAALAVLAATDGAGRPARQHPMASYVVPEARAADPAPAMAAPAAPAAPSTPNAESRAKVEADIPAGGARVDAEITIDERGMRITKPGRGAPHVTVGGHEYDSFEAFVEKAPWIAGLVFMTTALVFLVPLLVIILVIWYKMRRTRMMNETMLKLAERGVVPPGEAMQAIANGRPEPALQSGPATAPLYEQAKTLRRRAAWSDLRKGVILGAIGFGLTAYSMLEDGSANGLGLVLLFVGIGFVVLWYLEDRQAEERQGTPTSRSGGA
jgi:4-amino-4-deoxy-L-arabinose transferase-like glycosyltransferase